MMRMMRVLLLVIFLETLPTTTSIQSRCLIRGDPHYTPFDSTKSFLAPFGARDPIYLFDGRNLPFACPYEIKISGIYVANADRSLEFIHGIEVFVSKNTTENATATVIYGKDIDQTVNGGPKATFKANNFVLNLWSARMISITENGKYYEVKLVQECQLKVKLYKWMVVVTIPDKDSINSEALSNVSFCGNANGDINDEIQYQKYQIGGKKCSDFSLTKGRILIGFELETKQVATKEKCRSWCLTEPKCRGVNLTPFRESWRCELYPVTENSIDYPGRELNLRTGVGCPEYTNQCVMEAYENAEVEGGSGELGTDPNLDPQEVCSKYCLAHPDCKIATFTKFAQFPLVLCSGFKRGTLKKNANNANLKIAMVFIKKCPPV